MYDEILKCDICQGDIEQKKTPEGVVYWNRGENAQPYTEGRCCSYCHVDYVLPARREVWVK